MLSALSLHRRRNSLRLSRLSSSRESLGLRRVRFKYISHHLDEQPQCSTCGNKRYHLAAGEPSDEHDPLMRDPTALDEETTNTEAIGNQHVSRLRGNLEGVVDAAASKLAQSRRPYQKRSEEDGILRLNHSPRMSIDDAKSSQRNQRAKQQWHCSNPCRLSKILRFLFEDWLFLAVLGVLMAFMSLGVDTCIDRLQTFHMYLMNKVERSDDDLLNFLFTYVVWMLYTMVVMLASVVFVHYVGPQSIGSGIPEMKTILRGVRLKECLSFRTLLAKMVGLVLAIGSGFPIGKEGPFVHVGSIVANLLSRLVRNFKPAYVNESRSFEMLAAGCAAGVACTFSAPIGGVLFSIEVTAVYFAVRDYWRGFYAAACGSAVFSLLRLYTHSSEVTVVAFFQTTFQSRAFYPEELFIFALIGLFCGLTGAVFIFIHRQWVLFLRRNSFMKIIFQRNWMVYPLVISAFHATLTHPIGFGRHITGEVVFSHTLKDFFMNCTWSAERSRFEACAGSVAARWSADESIFMELTVFVIGFFFLSIVASTLPVPAGIFMPVFVIGAGMGRLFGEIVAHNFPDGLRGDRQMLVYPGIYAVVGAASFCGAVTHTVSVAVIAFELTGQLLHILPVMIAVIIANLTCSSFQPSFFDSIIKIKHLPYLPDIPKSTSQVHVVRAEQMMITNVQFLTKKSTYGEMQDLLMRMPRLRAFPVVDNPEDKVLLGSVSRATLLQLLDAQVGDEARRAEAARRAHRERELLDSMQLHRRRPVFDVGTPNLARIKAVENYELEIEEASRTSRLDIPSAVECEQCNKLAKCDVSEVSQEEIPNRLNRSASERHSRKKGIADPGAMWKSMRRTSSERHFRRHQGHHHLHVGHHKTLLAAHSAQEFYATLEGMIRNFTHTFVHTKKRRQGDDLLQYERHEWERQQLACVIKFSMAVIDPAPFQLVEDTSLYKVHSIFSLLGIRRAYVTKCGVLVGVVALRDLRAAIECTQWGELDSIHQRTEEVQEPPVIPRTRLQSCNSDILHETDLDSDTDNEDIILPRVEVDETTASTRALEQRLPLTRMSSDSSQYLAPGEADASAGLLSPQAAIQDGSELAAGHLPMRLQSYLDAKNHSPTQRQSKSTTRPKKIRPEKSKLRCHVHMLEPIPAIRVEPADDDGKAAAASSNRTSEQKPQSLSVDRSVALVPCGSQMAHCKDGVEKMASGADPMAAKCSVWIDEDEDGDVVSIQPSFQPPVSDTDAECSLPDTAHAHQVSPTTSGLNGTIHDVSNERVQVVVVPARSQRSISDVLEPSFTSSQPDRHAVNVPSSRALSTPNRLSESHALRSMESEFRRRGRDSTTNNNS